MPIGASYEWVDHCTEGAGETAYVWYCAGMPWAVSSRPVTLTNAQRRRMFGFQNLSATYSDAYPADDVEVAPYLMPPGEQTIRMLDTQAQLQGGDWTIEISDRNPGVDWDYTSRELFGLEGLHTMPDARVDDGMSSALLNTSLDWNDTSLSIKDDWGDKLHTEITTNHGNSKPTYLWIGSECVATSGAPGATSGQAFTVGITRGMYKTRPSNHLVDYANVRNLRIATAPIGGLAAARQSYLYAIPVDSDGVPTTANIALVRHGPVTSRTTFSNGKFRIRCGPWWKWLDTNIRLDMFSGQLRGYYLTRGNSDTDDQINNAGHMYIWEWDSGAWARRVMWLIADPGAGASDAKWFADWGQLREAIQAELDAMVAAGVGGTTANGSDGLEHKHRCDEYTISQLVTETGDKQDTVSYLGGPIPWLLGLGAPNIEHRAYWSENMRKDEPFYQQSYPLAARYFAHLRRCAYDGEYYEETDGDDTIYSPDVSAIGPDYRAQYVYQWDWRDETSIYMGNVGEPIDVFPVPDGYGGNPDLYVDSTYNLDLIDTAIDLTIGSRKVRIDGKRTLSKAPISSVDTTNRKIVISNYGSTSNPFATNLPMIERSISSADPGPFKQGHLLAYIPAFHPNGDPWMLSQSLSLRSYNLKSIFQTLFHDSSPPLEMAWQLRMNHIPDLYEYSVNGSTEQFATIDWDSWDDVVTKFSDQQYYELTFDKEMNILDLMTEELKLHGVCPTWEYDSDDHQYRMRFRHMGVIEPSRAYADGRTLDDSDREVYAISAGELAGEAMYTSVDAQTHYVPGTSADYLLKPRAQTQDAWEVQGGRPRSLDIKSKITKFASVAQWENSQTSDFAVQTDLEDQPWFQELVQELREHLGVTVLAHGMLPMPELAAKSNLGPSVKHGVGTSLLITDPTARNAYNLGTIGTSDWPGIVSEVRTNLAEGKTRVKYRLGYAGTFNIAPACEITASTHTAHSVSVTAVTANAFSNLFGRTDLSYFADYSFNPAVGGDLVTESTDTFYVNVYERSDSTDVTAGKDGLFFSEVAVSNVDVSAGTCTLSKTGIGSTWDDSATYVMVYAYWDGGNLADAQRRWIYLAQNNGLLDDGSSTMVGRPWE